MYPEAFEKWYERNGLKQKQEAYKEWLETEAPVNRPRTKHKPKNKKQKGKQKQQKPQYHEYIRSLKWRKKSHYWRKRTKACEVCGSENNLQCHHKHYRTLGHEQRRDIMVVCYTCHCKLHDVQEFVDKMPKSPIQANTEIR
jgi:hypothetical protein